MKVKDTLTGALLETRNEAVADMWRNKPDRYVPVDGEGGISALTVEQLKQYAAEKNIDIAAAKNKQAILDILLAKD